MPGPNRYGSGGKLLPKKPRKYVSGQGWSQLTPAEQASPYVPTYKPSRPERAQYETTKARIAKRRASIRRERRQERRAEIEEANKTTVERVADALDNNLAAQAVATQAKNVAELATSYKDTPSKGPLSNPLTRAMLTGPTYVGKVFGIKGRKEKKVIPNSLERQAAGRVRAEKKTEQSIQRQLTISRNQRKVQERQQRQRGLPRPATSLLKGPSKNTKQEATVAKALDKQKRNVEKARADKERVTIAGQIGSRANDRRDTIAPQTVREQLGYYKKAVPRFKADTDTKASAGGRTPQEMLRGIAAQESALGKFGRETGGRGANISQTNLTVADEGWKRQGGKPKTETIAQQMFAALPKDRRKPTQAQLLKNKDYLDSIIIEASRSSYDDAKKEDLPEARDHRNPWFLSDAQAPKNETAAEKFAREQKVIERLLGRRPGTGFETVDAFKQQQIRQDPTLVQELLQTEAAKRVGLDNVKFVNHLMDAASRGDVGAITSRLIYDRPGGLGVGLMTEDAPKYEATAGDYLQVAATLAAMRGLGGLFRGGAARLKDAGRLSGTLTEEGTKLGITKAMIAEGTKIAETTRYGKAAAKLLELFSKPAVQKGYNIATASTAIGGVGALEATGNLQPIVEGTFTAKFGKAAPTTARALIMAITGPAAWAGNLALMTRRGIGAIGNDDPYYSSLDYVASPVVRLAEESWKEMERMAQTYTSKDVDKIRAATEEDYGYITLMSAGYLARPLTAGALKMAGEAIARTPAGQAVVKEIRRWNVTQKVKDWRETGETIRRTGVAVGRADVLYEKFINRVAQPKQRFNSTPEGKKIVAALDDEAAAVNAGLSKKGAADGVPKVEVEDVVIMFATKGITTDTTVGRLKAIRRNVEQASMTYRTLTAAIRHPEMWRGRGPAARYFNQMLVGARKNSDGLRAARRRRFQEDEEGTPISASQLARDDEVLAQELLLTKAQQDGGTVDPRPSDELASRRERQAGELDEARREREDMDARIDELSQQLGTAKQVVEAAMIGERERTQANRKKAKAEEEQRTVGEELFALEVRLGDPQREEAVRDRAKRRTALRRELRRLTGESYRAGQDSGYWAGRAAEEARRAAKGESKLQSSRERKRRAEKAETDQQNARARVNEILRELDDIETQTLRDEQELRRLTRLRGKLYGIEQRIEAFTRRENPAIQQAYRDIQEIKKELKRLRTRERPALDRKIKRLAEVVEGRLNKEEVDAVYAALENDSELSAKGLSGKPLQVKLALLLNRQRELRDDFENNERIIELLNQELSVEEIQRIIADEVETDIWTARKQREEAYDIARNPESYVDLPEDTTPASRVVALGQARRDARLIIEESHAAEARALRLLSDAEALPEMPLRGRLRKKAVQEFETKSLRLIEQIGVRQNDIEMHEMRAARDMDSPQFKALLTRAKLEKKAELDSAELQVLLNEMYAKVEHIIETNESLTMPTFITHKDAASTSDPVSAQERDTGLATPREQRRTGALAEKGRETRTWAQQVTTYQRQLRAEKNRNLTKWVASYGLYTAVINGKKRKVFRRDEFDELKRIYREETGRELFQDFLYMDQQFLDHPDEFGSFINILVAHKREDDLQDHVDAAQGTDGDGTHQFRSTLDDEEISRVDRLTEKIAANERAAGRGYVLISKPIATMLKKQQMELNSVERWLFEINRASSRLVLGTSISWMLAQPIAELAVLAAQHPIRMWPALAEARKLSKLNNDGWLAAATLARGTPGTDPINNKRTKPTTLTENAKNYQELFGIMKKLPGWLFIDELDRTRRQQKMSEIASLGLFGQFDRWKGAWIREAGLLAELDSQLSTKVRAAKAIKGQVDAMERASAKLATMSREEQLKWLVSDEGIEAGMELAKHIDDQLGNWTDLRPGLESFVGQIVFFYPFLRFSLNWMLRTYPRDHPVVWTVAALLGIANGEMLQRLVNYDPAWPGEWAVAPLFGAPGEDSMPTSFIPLSRYAWGGNVATELLVNDATDPGWAILTKLAPPLLTQPLLALASLDPYGNKLRDENDTFGESNAGNWAKAGAAIDNFMALIAPYRHIKTLAAQKGWTDGELSFQGWFDPSGEAFQTKSPFGVDPNPFRKLFRDSFIAGFPTPTRISRMEQSWNRRVDRINAAKGSRTYEYKGEKYIDVDGKRVNFKRFAKAQIAARKETQDAGKQYNRRAKEKQRIVKEYLNILRENADNREKVKAYTGQLWRWAKKVGAEFNEDDWLRSEIMDRRYQRGVQVKTDFADKFEGYKYPGFKEAQRMLQTTEEADGTVSDGVIRKGGKKQTNEKLGGTPDGAKFNAKIISESNARLSKLGYRRVDTDRIPIDSLPKAVQQYVKATNKAAPRGFRNYGEFMLSDKAGTALLDPETEVEFQPAEKKGSTPQLIVKKWRGYNVVGEPTFSEMRNADAAVQQAPQKSGGTQYRYHKELDALMLPEDFKKRQKLDQMAEKVDGAAVVVNKKRKQVEELLMKVEGRVPIEGDEGVFVNTLAKLSGLSAKVVAAWTRQENGNQYDDWNRLNIGHTDSGPIPLTADARWSSPVEAAKLTNQFLRGQWGGASESIQGIIPNAKGKSDQEQINVIASTDWAGDPEYQQNITNVYADVPDAVPANPKAKKQLQAARAKAKAATNDLQQTVAEFEKLATKAKKQGIPVPNPVGPVGGGTQGGKPKPFNGKFNGARRAVSLVLGQPVWGDHMPDPSGQFEGGPDESVGGHSSGGQHALSNAYAQDIGTSGGRPEEGEEGLGYDQPTVDKIVAGLQKMGSKIPDNFQIGEDWEGEVLPNGYQPTILSSAASGHSDHIHFGMEWVGGGTSGGTTGGSGVSGGGASVSSGGSASGGTSGGTGGGNLTPEQAVTRNIKKLRALPVGGKGQDYEDAGVDSSVTSVAAASEATDSGDGVKSVAEQMASLPSVGSKKKKVPRFPSNPI